MLKPRSFTGNGKETNMRYPGALLLILLVLSVLCIYQPHTRGYSIFNRTWGFDHIVFYSLGSRITFYLACLFIILPFSNHFIVQGISRLAAVLSRVRTKKIILFLFVSLVSVFIFYLFQVKYYFLGDFNIRMMQTMKKEFLATEYLTMRLLYAFTSFGARYGYSHDQLFRLYSYLAGAAFVFLSCLVADISGKTSFQKTLFFLAQVCSALLLVFCGYVEVYATPVVALMLYVYFTLRYLQTGSGFVWALLSLALAIACHLLCLAALPSLLIAWYFKNKQKLPFIAAMSHKKIALLVAAMIVIVLFAAIKTGHVFLLTLKAPALQPGLLTLFSYKHFWEIFNGQLLCCGLSFLLIFILLIKSMREKKELFAEHYFLLSISGCFFLLIFVANLQRGSGDWDIMAFTAVTLNLVSAMLITHLYRSNLPLVQYLLTALVCLNALNTFLWLRINHTDLSIKKIETMLVNDPGTYYTARISGAIQLALAYKNNGLIKQAGDVALAVCNSSPPEDVKACVMYALTLKETKRFEEARLYFEDLLKNRTPYVYEAYLYLLEYYEKKKDYEKFDYYLTLLYDSFVQRPDPFFNNVNFKPKSLMELFKILYQIEKKTGETQRTIQMKNVILALRDMKPAQK